MVAFVDAAGVDDFREAVIRSYYGATGLHPEVYPVESAPGASVFEPQRDAHCEGSLRSSSRW